MARGLQQRATPHQFRDAHPQLNIEQAGTTCLDPYAEKLTLRPGPASGTQAAAITSVGTPSRDMDSLYRAPRDCKTLGACVRPT
jgi:hypothetical protein